MRSTLGSLVASALEQMGTVREVVERGAQAQRSRYDTVRLERRRRDAMAALGEVFYRLAVRGRLGELGEDPEVRAQLEEIDGIDQRMETADQAERGGFAVNSGWGSSERASAPRRRGPAGEVRVWRPVPPFAAPDDADDADELADELVDAAAEADDAPAVDDERPRRALSGRGISFGDDWDDDDDLEEYMCDDDVPATTAAAQPPPASEPAADHAPPAKAKPRKRRAAKGAKK